MLSHTCKSFFNQYTSFPFAVYLAPTYAVLGITYFGFIYNTNHNEWQGNLI